MADKKFGEAAVGKTMGASAEALFDGVNGAFYLANVTIRCNNVEVERGQGVAGAFKFLVPVNDVNNMETADGVKVDGSVELVDDGLGRAVGDGSDGTETDVVRDRVEETEFLDKKEIDAECDVAVVCKNWRWKWHSKERGGMSGRGGACRLPLEGGNMGAVDGKGVVCIIHSDGAVENKVVLEDVTEIFLSGRPSMRHSLRARSACLTSCWENLLLCSATVWRRL